MSQSEEIVIEAAKEDKIELSPEFLEQLNALNSLDEQLRLCIETMRSSIAQEGSPHFKAFWNVRKQALLLFKNTNITASVRNQLWKEFIDITQEGRQLKKILEEQSSFAIEQIDKAIEALEAALNTEGKFTGEKVDLEEFPEVLKAVESDIQDLQAEIHGLSTFASRIQSLRQEVLNTEMRIKFRNQFLQRLSHAGDLVFPIKKEKVATLGKLFEEGVRDFLKGLDNKKLTFYQVRHEIKTLQAAAKLFFLSTPVFTKTRMQLSKKWDEMREREKEWKQKKAEKKDLYQENLKNGMEKIEACRQEVEKLKPEQIRQKVKEVQNFIRDLELSGYEKRALYEELDKLKETLPDSDAAEKKKAKRGINEQKAMVAKWETVVKKAEIFNLEAEDVWDQWEAVANEIADATASELEKFSLRLKHEGHLDALWSKKGEECLASGEVEAIEKLLCQLDEREKGIRDQLDECRKWCGTSGLDFKENLEVNEHLKVTKERLDALEKLIIQLEKKCDD